MCPYENDDDHCRGVGGVRYARKPRINTFKKLRLHARRRVLRDGLR